MIVDAVRPSGDAVVSIRLFGPSGPTAEIQAIVDTGFNDWLTPPRGLIDSLSLPFREEGRYQLADGSVSVTRLFVAEVDWLGRRRRILAIEMETEPLLGMRLLTGCYLGIDVVDGGLVEISMLEA